MALEADEGIGRANKSFRDRTCVLPGNLPEARHGDREGQHSIRIKDQWRICFRFENSNAYDVEIVRGARSISADTDLRLSIYFGTSQGYWLRLQNSYDLEEARRHGHYEGIRPRVA